jgi:ABC-type Fe3+ transport system permease subunit
MLASMARGDRFRTLMAPVRSGRRTAYDFGATVFSLAFALTVLMLFGLVVRGVSTVVGAPLPYVHDDPNRIEWGGVAELVGYGLAAAITLYVLYAFAERALPATGRGYLERIIGAAALLLLAVSGAWVAIDNWDPAVGIFALVCGTGAVRVMRGLPLDDEHDREVGGSGHPAK